MVDRRFPGATTFTKQRTSPLQILLPQHRLFACLSANPLRHSKLVIRTPVMLTKAEVRASRSSTILCLDKSPYLNVEQCSKERSSLRLRLARDAYVQIAVRVFWARRQDMPRFGVGAGIGRSRAACTPVATLRHLHTTQVERLSINLVAHTVNFALAIYASVRHHM